MISAQKAEDELYHLFVTVAETLKKKRELKQSEIKRAVGSICKEYVAQHWKFDPSFSGIDFNDIKKCCGYLQQIATCHAALTRTVTQNYFEKLPVVKQMLLKKQCLRVVCAGGGPGNDFIGFYSAIGTVMKNSNTSSIDLTIVDLKAGWKEVFESIIETMTSTHFNSFEHLPLVYRFIQADLTHEKRSEIQKADLILMVKVLSQVSTEQKIMILKNIFSSMKNNAVFFYIDKDASLVKGMVNYFGNNLFKVLVMKDRQNFHASVSVPLAKMTSYSVYEICILQKCSESKINDSLNGKDAHSDSLTNRDAQSDPLTARASSQGDPLTAGAAQGDPLTTRAAPPIDPLTGRDAPRIDPLTWRDARRSDPLTGSDAPRSDPLTGRDAHSNENKNRIYLKKNNSCYIRYSDFQSLYSDPNFHCDDICDPYFYNDFTISSHVRDGNCDHISTHDDSCFNGEWENYENYLTNDYDKGDFNDHSVDDSLYDDNDKNYKNLSSDESLYDDDTDYCNNQDDFNSYLNNSYVKRKTKRRCSMSIKNFHPISKFHVNKVKHKRDIMPDWKDVAFEIMQIEKYDESDG